MTEEIFTTEEALDELLQNYENDDGEEPGIEAPTIMGEHTGLSSSESESDDEESLQEEDLPQRSRKRIRATRSKRLVRSLCSALNPANYDEIPTAVNTMKTYTSFLEKPSPNAKTITWVNARNTVTVGRQPRSSVILGRPGPIGAARFATDCL